MLKGLRLSAPATTPRSAEVLVPVPPAAPPAPVAAPPAITGAIAVGGGGRGTAIRGGGTGGDPLATLGSAAPDAEDVLRTTLRNADVKRRPFCCCGVLPLPLRFIELGVAITGGVVEWSKGKGEGGSEPTNTDA